MKFIVFSKSTECAVSFSMRLMLLLVRHCLVVLIELTCVFETNSGLWKLKIEYTYVLEIAYSYHEYRRLPLTYYAIIHIV